MTNKFMMKAIELSIKSVNSGTGPFGAVIVKDNKIISEGFNIVTSSNDPTSHAEIVAIRNACKILNNFSLRDCDLYTTCEPCPMCLSAIYWARIDKVYYANTRRDAKKIDFSDEMIYEELNKNIKDRKISMHQMMREEALKAFDLWGKKEDKVKY
ncbi:MAG: tRNA(Arg) A34 adenosine deaminase TadA [Pelagibacterales bacterium]|nr:tRNA(Arg) A34 adenosine deaminase TadA [Pelagibacterales bacterium]